MSGDGSTVDDLVSNRETPSPVSRKVQKLGRIDIPDEILGSIGVDIGDDVFVVYNEDRSCIEIHDRVEVLSDALDL